MCAKTALFLLLVLKDTWSLSQVLKRSTSECVHVRIEETSRSTNTGKEKEKTLVAHDGYKKRHNNTKNPERSDAILKRGQKKTETRES